MMKKISFLLLILAGMTLAGCENEKVYLDPNEPAQPTETEADFIIKFYASDTLLQYANFTIRNEKDTTVTYTNYTITVPDTMKADTADWNHIYDAIKFVELQNELTVENSKIITLKVHLTKSNKEHAFRILYTRNTVPVHSEEINFICGGAVWKIMPTRTDDLRKEAIAYKGVDTKQLTTYFNMKSVVNTCTMAFTY